MKGSLDCKRRLTVNQRAIKDITDFIFMNDPPQKSDVIFIPGTSQSAISEKAAELYRAGFAEYVMPAGLYSGKRGRFAHEKIDNPRYAGEYASDYAYCRHILLENGVPESAVLREERSTNTGENAEFSALVLRDLGISVKRAILCCQSFHARRAFMTYGKHFPDTEILVVPTDTQGIRREDWYLRENSYRRVMSEVYKCGQYFLEYAEA
ncbi:MAG: YdcF family protein [Oscillospiraceae bacterium]|nr:YdcF family protein [Oscillospiraceae bacterium]